MESPGRDYMNEICSGVRSVKEGLRLLWALQEEVLRRVFLLRNTAGGGCCKSGDAG